MQASQLHNGVRHDDGPGSAQCIRTDHASKQSMLVMAKHCQSKKMIKARSSDVSSVQGQRHEIEILSEMSFE